MEFFLLLKLEFVTSSLKRLSLPQRESILDASATLHIVTAHSGGGRGKNEMGKNVYLKHQVENNDSKCFTNNMKNLWPVGVIASKLYNQHHSFISLVIEPED
jgi:hypothetical protein